MLRDNLAGLIEPMRISARVDPLALSIQKQASDDRSSCLENPRPEGAESSLTENVTSPFQAEPAHQELLEDGAFITAQLAGNEVVYSVVLTNAGNPLSRESVESHFKGELSKK